MAVCNGIKKNVVVDVKLSSENECPTTAHIQCVRWPFNRDGVFKSQRKNKLQRFQRGLRWKQVDFRMNIEFLSF